MNNATWTSYALETITGFKDKITNGHVATQSPIVTWATNLKTWFNSSSFGAINNAKWTSYALETITGFKDKITNGHSATQSPMTTWATNLRTWFTSSSHGNINKSKWESFASDVINGFKDKVSNTYTTTKDSITTWANAVKGWFEKPDGVTTLKSHFESIGTNLVEGLWNGINGATEWIKKKIGDWVGDVEAFLKDLFGIESPSKLMRDEIGVFLPLGIAAGFDKAMPKALQDIQDSTHSLFDSVQSTVNSKNIGMRFAVDDSALKNYTANYGTDFTDAAITHKVQREMGFNSSMQAEIDGGKFSEGMRRVIAEEVAPFLEEIRIDTKRQADKKETVNVEIGRKSITDAVVTQQRADGFNFTPSYA